MLSFISEKRNTLYSGYICCLIVNTEILPPNKIRRAFDKQRKGIQRGPTGFMGLSYIVEISFFLNFCEFLAYNLSSSSSLRRFMKYRE